MYGNNISNILTGAPSDAQMGVPTSVNPGGGPQSPQDPAAYGAQVAVMTLRKLGQMYTQLGDAMLGNQVDALANKLNKLHLSRQKQLQNSWQQVQTSVLGAQI